MPSPRSLAGTFTLLSTAGPAANSTLPPTGRRPSPAVSRPAIERSVVVLPQPDGPSRVNSSPGFDLEADVVDGEHPRSIAVGRRLSLPRRFCCSPSKDLTKF